MQWEGATLFLERLQTCIVNRYRDANAADRECRDDACRIHTYIMHDARALAHSRTQVGRQVRTALGFTMGMRARCFVF
jgi:hypothetical protein